MNIKGLDVSEFQGEINWERVKNAGYQFAMIRAGYGFNTIDKQFQRNASECNRIGLPIGVYWFCYAVSPETAIQEADGCLRTIRNYRIDYPVCYDIEQASAAYALGEGVTITPALAKQLVSSFCNRIEAGGYYAMFYTNRSFLDNYLGNDLAKRYARVLRRIPVSLTAVNDILHAPRRAHRFKQKPPKQRQTSLCMFRRLRIVNQIGVCSSLSLAPSFFSFIRRK